MLTWSKRLLLTAMMMLCTITTARAYQVSCGNYTDTIVMYSTTWCPYCTQARAFFHANNVTFVEYFVDRDQYRHHELMRRVGHAGVPAIFACGGVYHGFDATIADGIYRSLVR